MNISEKSWQIFAKRMASIDSAATKKVQEFIESYPGFSYDDPESMNALVEFSYGISTTYGEAAAELACEMYDAMAAASGVYLDPAVPALTPTYKEVNGTLRETSKISQNDEYISSRIGRLVKRTGADTTLQNAKRDRAEFAWVPIGDTCAFCITLASQGWQYVSSKSFSKGHAEHIHGNCDCSYAVRFNKDTNIRGYNPQKYLDMYNDAEGRGSKAKINYMRRQAYAENKEEINAQKRSAYEKRKELNSSEAEEIKA